MKRSTLVAALVCACLAAAGPGCGGDDSSINPPGSVGFGGSCVVTVTTSGITVTICTDFNASTTAAVQQGCAQANGSGGATTSYGAGHCTTASLVGKCAIATSTTVNYYYPTTGLSAAQSKQVSQTACTNQGGVWSDP